MVHIKIISNWNSHCLAKMASKENHKLELRLLIIWYNNQTKFNFLANQWCFIILCYLYQQNKFTLAVCLSFTAHLNNILVVLEHSLNSPGASAVNKKIQKLLKNKWSKFPKKYYYWYIKCIFLENKLMLLSYSRYNHTVFTFSIIVYL